ncbi:MAG TPA: CdaR family protein [bacterium]|jgi:YbbR domain-containing protein|nr:CdaR family protein [bacterium]
MVRRLLTENIGLKLLALFLAIGLVYIRAREKITSQEFSNVRIELVNIPSNMVLAYPDRLYNTTIVLQGPVSVLKFLTSKDLRFALDLAGKKELEQNKSLLIALSQEFLVARVKEQDAKQLKLRENNIHPSKVQITVHIRDVSQKNPPPIYASESLPEDTIEIPLYQLVKHVPVRVPTVGQPPEGYEIVTIRPYPSTITITGPEAALSRISEVSTTRIYLSNQIQSGTTADVPISEFGTADLPVSATATRVNIELKVARTKGG